MATVMTDFVRQMDSAVGPSQELFSQTWQALRGMLRAEMQRRSNWQGPPSYLGILGHPSWTAREGTDALDELVSECFEFIFIRRRKSLRDHARHRISVDGLITLGVRHFLLYNQRRHDPLGFRVFEVLREALRLGIDQGDLEVIAGDPRIRNDTWLMLPGASTGLDHVPAADPEELATRWSREYLEELVGASREDLRRLKHSLVQEIIEWLGDGSARVRFGDLAAPLKTQCRQAWAGRFLDTSWGRQSEPPRVVDESFTALARCVRHRIQNVETRPKTRTYLRRLWGFLETFADRNPKGHANGLESLPSSRRLGDLLDIPRARVPELLKSLGGQLQACTRESGNPGRPYTAAERARPSLQNRTFARLQESLEAQSAQDPSGPHGTDAAPRLGDIVAFESSVDGVFWRAGEIQAEGRRFTAVDRFPFVGPDDTVLSAPGTAVDPDDGWVVRSQVELLLPSTLPEWRLVDRPSTSDEPTAGGEVSREGMQRVAADWIEYVDWMERGPRRAATLVNRQIPRRRSGRRSSTWLALAAVLTVALLGFGLERARLESRLDQLSRPILGLPYAEIMFDPNRRGDQPLQLAPDTTHVQIGLVLRRIPDHSLYAIRLVNGDGEILYQSPDLAGRLSYSLTFPIATLSGEGLRFQLFGFEEGGRPELLDEQKVTIRWSTES